MTSLKKLLTPPVFEDELKTQQAHVLFIVLWTLFLVPIPFAIYNLLFVTEDSERFLIQTLIGEAINGGLLLLLRHGYVRAASVLQVITFWLFFTVIAFTGGGVQGGAYLLGYSIVIAIAGMLFGGVGAAILTVLSLLSGIALLNAQSLGFSIAPFNSDPPLATWVVSLVLFPVSALLQYLGSQALRSALQRARTSEERYRLISRITSDYTFSTELNAHGKMHLNWVTGAFEEITGYTYDEYVASGGWRAHLYPEDLDQDERDMDVLRANQKVITEVRHFKKNGELRWARVYAQPIWDSAANRLGGIVGAVQDITEQKEVKEGEVRRQLMLEKVIHLGKQVTEVSDLRSTVEKIWHAVHDELEFARVAIFLYNADRKTMDDTFGTSNDGEMLDYWHLSFPLGKQAGVIDAFTRVLEKPDALYFTHQYDAEHEVAEDMQGVKDFASVAAWAGTKPVAVLCVDNLPTTNAISTGQLEALRLFAGYAGLAIENARLNTSLQHELAQRQSFIGELEAKNAELERFTYTVSHDLKSPLVTITGFLGFLEKDALAGDINRVQAGVSRISDAARKMEHLLNDLLELSRIGRLMNPAENVSFDEIVQDALERVRGRIEEHNIQVSIAKDLPVVHGDHVRLIEIMQNLLDNAAKFSSSAADPRIEVGMKGWDENLHPILFVCDNGIGIAPDFHERIFGLFNKLNPQIEGTGIGLTLVKRIVEVHGGTIWVESAPGHGATFYFTLPAQEHGDAGIQLGA